MNDAERRACLDRLGTLLVEARDAVLDEVQTIFTEDGGGSVASFVRSGYRQGGLTEQELCDVTAFTVDRLMYELAYKFQDAEIDHDLTLAVSLPSQPAIAINKLSDGFAGEFMTEDGWFARKSRHGRNRFEQYE